MTFYKRLVLSKENVTDDQAYITVGLHHFIHNKRSSS